MSETRVMAVVPTYSPDASLTERLRTLAGHVDSVIAVDDGTPIDRQQPLLDARDAGFEVIESDVNRGIGAALNAGVRIALGRGATHVLTLDQDTLLPEGYVDACLRVFALNEPGVQIGVVCAESVNGSPTLPHARTMHGIGLLSVAIQSGFVVSSTCFGEAGLFDERLFIDMVDTEFCLRIAGHGFQVAAAPGTDLAHSLGEKKPLRWFGIVRRRNGRPRDYEYHSPVRGYFIVRNAVDMYLRYGRKHPRWVASSLRQIAPVTIRTIASGPHSGRQFLAGAVGLMHGLVRRRGPLGARLRKALTPRES